VAEPSPEAVVRAAVSESIAAHQRLLESDSLGRVLAAAERISSALSNDGKLLLFGNGGSASDASHIAAEFVGRFQRERRALPALALSVDQPALTAIANDYGFEQVFARQIEALGRSSDVALAISTSGRSPNVLEGVRAARAAGIQTIGLTGGDGGQLAEVVDVCVCVGATNTARVQETHILVGHLLCELVELAIT
jgi:D-sedoheptulose 7-phosphate isomerase